MTNILVIDSSQANAAVGLAVSNAIRTLTSENSQHSAQEVLPLIKNLLTSAAMELEDLDAIGVVTGPGSFTGLRIGIGVAQGLGAALDIPMLALSSLALLALSGNVIHDRCNWLVAQQAREQEFYFAAYQVTKELGCELLGVEQVVSASGEVPLQLQIPGDSVSEQNWAAVGSAWQNASLQQQLIDRLKPERIFSLSARIEDACVLATLEFSRGQAGRELILPNYVKEELDYS